MAYPALASVREPQNEHVEPDVLKGPLAPRVCGLTTSSILKLNIIDYILIVSRVLIY